MLRRYLLPLVVALIVLIGQPMATLFVIQASVHRETPPALEPVWFILFLPSTIVHRFVYFITGMSLVQVFGAFTADVLLGFGLDAVVWALIAGLLCAIIQKRLTTRSSERVPGVRPTPP
jgi:hypothetical protein